MNKTTHRETEQPIAVDINGLCALLSCGKSTARRIAVDARARIIIGRRVLYSVEKVQQYIRDLAE